MVAIQISVSVQHPVIIKNPKLDLFRFYVVSSRLRTGTRYQVPGARYITPEMVFLCFHEEFTLCTVYQWSYIIILNLPPIPRWYQYQVLNQLGTKILHLFYYFLLKLFANRRYFTFDGLLCITYQWYLVPGTRYPGCITYDFLFSTYVQLNSVDDGC